MWIALRCYPTHMNIETQPEDLASLYRRAFAKYSALALWNERELRIVTRKVCRQGRAAEPDARRISATLRICVDHFCQTKS